MKYNFIILSNQPFDSELKTNKWHIANELSRQGNRVLFVDPPLRFKVLKSFLKHPSLNFLRLFFGFERKSESLLVYHPANLFNFFPFSYLNTYFHLRQIQKLKNSVFDMDNKTILYVYHFDFPDLENVRAMIKSDLMIYDCVDEYTEFPEYSHGKKVNPSVISLIQSIDDFLKKYLNQGGLTGPSWVLHREKWLVDNSGLVFASAPGLVSKLKKWKNEIHFLPNAADAKAFDYNMQKFEEPSDLKPIPHPRIGFSGAIDSYKNNIELIEKCAKAYPSYHFVLIGPEKISDPDLDLTTLKKQSNVHFLGLKKWEQTPAYFHYFDAYFIPYNLNKYTVGGCFPVKYFEGLAAGLPTVVTDLPAYSEYDVDGYVSKNDEEFITNLQKAVTENNNERKSKRLEMAYKNTYEGKANRIISLINDYFMKK